MILKFAENWTVPKFTYGVSLVVKNLSVAESDIPIVKN